MERPGRLEKSESWEVGELPGAPCGESLGNTILTGVKYRVFRPNLLPRRGDLDWPSSRLTLSDQVPTLAQGLTFRVRTHLFSLCCSFDP